MTQEGYPTAPQAPAYQQQPYQQQPYQQQQPYPNLPPQQNIPYSQPSQPQEIHVIHVRQEPVQQQPPPNDDLGIAPALYCACCAIFLIPFGWIIGIAAGCWVSRLSKRRQLSRSEKTATKVLHICLWVNLILTILFLIFV